MSDIRVKICGLSTPETIAAAADAGAAYVGFVFFEKSPRNVSVSQALDLAVDVPMGVAKVALTVNADDAALDAIMRAVPFDMIQLSGRETPERVSEVRALTGLPVMKAVGIANADDVDRLAAYEEVADQILVDAKPPSDGGLPGGNGLSFDWRLISNRRWALPWMLAGGLDAANVAEAILLTGARQVDLSSGVESAPGVKDVRLIQSFMKAALI